MAPRNAKPSKSVKIQGDLPGELKVGISKFRAKKQIADQPISSDWKALCALATLGLESVGLKINA